MTDETQGAPRRSHGYLITVYMPPERPHEHWGEWDDGENQKKDETSVSSVLISL